MIGKGFLFYNNDHPEGYARDIPCLGRQALSGIGLPEEASGRVPPDAEWKWNYLPAVPDDARKWQVAGQP